MKRRRFLLAATSLGILSGCSSSGSPPDEDSTPTVSRKITATDRTRTTDGSPSTESDVLFVGPDGSDENRGTKRAPMATIELALKRAKPGQTVRLKPGKYFQSPETRKPGTADAPITLTGPPDAVIAGDPERGTSRGLMIRHSHVHLTGITFDGLQDPSAPDSPESYMEAAIGTLPAGDEYLEDIVVKPHAVGNSRGNLIHIAYSENVEIGEFRVIGPAGLNYKLTDEPGHWGEIVYIGIAKGKTPNAIDLSGELKQVDTTNNVHVHHIDNSDGHHHSELVNPKMGTFDILVEYCTDAGGSQNTEEGESASVRLQGYGAAVRWCDLRNGKGHGVAAVPGDLPDDVDVREPTNPAIELYGNRVTGFDDKAFVFESMRPESATPEQLVFCGNEFDGQTDGTPDTECSASIPTGDGIGHTGGDSPW